MLCTRSTYTQRDIKTYQCSFVHQLIRPYSVKQHTYTHTFVPFVRFHWIAYTTKWRCCLLVGYNDIHLETSHMHAEPTFHGIKIFCDRLSTRGWNFEMREMGRNENERTNEWCALFDEKWNKEMTLINIYHIEYEVYTHAQHSTLHQINGSADEKQQALVHREEPRLKINVCVQRRRRRMKWRIIKMKRRKRNNNNIIASVFGWCTQHA